MPPVQLVRIADTEETRARVTGERLNVEWSTSYLTLLDDPAIDGVVLATPTPLHADMIAQAAAAGKHVFCEKPISLELAPTLPGRGSCLMTRL